VSAGRDVGYAGVNVGEKVGSVGRKLPDEVTVGLTLDTEEGTLEPPLWLSVGGTELTAVGEAVGRRLTATVGIKLGDNMETVLVGTTVPAEEGETEGDTVGSAAS
jgi:hypothetical protein